MIRRVTFNACASLNLNAAFSSCAMPSLSLPLRNRVATSPPLVSFNSFNEVGSRSDSPSAFGADAFFEVVRAAGTLTGSFVVLLIVLIFII